MPAAEMARAYVGIVEDDRTGQVLDARDFGGDASGRPLGADRGSRGQLVTLS